MTNEGAGPEEIRRQFEDMIAGMDPSELPAVIGALSRAGAARVPLPSEPPRFRKEPLDQRVVLRIRVDLDEARPPIWRRLDVRSDVTLEDLHRIIQAAFGWLDYHLYRFALGGSPFDRASEMFLCAFDLNEGEDVGAPVSEVRLDETLHEPGDVLRYAYDYGDSWELTLRVESVHDADDTTPAAHCVDGRRAAPPEDCGGRTDAESLAEVLDDPAHFDIEEVNAALDDPIRRLFDADVHPRLAEVIYRLEPGDPTGDVHRRAARLLDDPPVVDPDQLASDLRPYLWFLDRAGGDGLALTSAGYLKPAEVSAASAVVPAMRHWFGAKNREVQCAPLLDFRESLQRNKLLRKYKGRLVLTRLAKGLAGDAYALAEHIAHSLAPTAEDRFTAEATHLVLFFAATSEDGTVPLDRIASSLTYLDWRHEDGGPIEDYDLYHLDGEPYETLKNLSAPVAFREPLRLSPTAIAVARAALKKSEASLARSDN